MACNSMAAVTGVADDDGAVLEILTLVATGLSSAEIAARFVLSGRNVDNHVNAIFRKLGVRNREAARAAAIELRLCD